MFNKIFRRGKTAKDDAPPLPSYKNSLKSSTDYEYGPKNFNNKPPYSTHSNTTVPNKYTPINDIPPPWSSYDPTKYDSSPANRTQNVYTAPPQRNLPYNQENANIPTGREYDKPFQQFSTVGSPNQNQYIPPYKTNNITYSNRTDKPESRYDTTSGDRSPYITLGSTYSQGRPPPYEPFKRDGSTSRAPNSQPGTPTPGRRELYDTYRSTPNRTFESPQRDPIGIGTRSTFSPATNNRFNTRVYESPVRENILNKNNIGSYNYTTPNFNSDTPVRNISSPYNQYPSTLNQEPIRHNNNKNAYGSNYSNSATPSYNESNTTTYRPLFNANSISNPAQAPPSPEPGKYVPYAVRKALKEQQQQQQQKAQQANHEESKTGYYNSNSNNSTNPAKSKSPTSKYTFNPYKPAYETSDIAANKINSPYNNAEKPLYEQANPKIASKNFEPPVYRVVSPPIPNYGNRLFEQKSYNEPPELPPKNIALKNRTTDLNRNFSANTNTSQNYPTPPNYGYYNIDQNENKSPYRYTTNQTPYSPSIKSPPPSQHDYINLSATPKPFSSSQPNTNVLNKNANYEFNNNINPTLDRFSGKQFNNSVQNTDATNHLFNTINNTAPDAYSYTTPPHHIATSSKTTYTPLFNENKHANNTISNRSIYEPQKNLYDTHQSYVQMPQYNYGSGEQTTTTIPTNTNAFNDWLPNNTSNLNENLPYSSTRNESELWKREKDNASADEFSSIAFGTVPSNVNVNEYLNDKKNLEHRSINNDSSLKKDNNFGRYSTFKQSEKQQEEKPILNYKSSEQVPLSQQTSSPSYSIASPLIDAASISVATVNAPYQFINNPKDEESENERQSSSEQINEITIEDRKSKSPKKSVRFFNNPIDKSRDFISDIMAKGRNRGHNKHRNGNNHKKSKDIKNDTTKSPLIVPNDATNESETLGNLNSKHESEISNNLKNINDSSDNNNKSEISTEADANSNCKDDKIGYQITKSKNSRDIVHKLQNSRAKLASPEDDESDNIFGKNERNSVDNHKNKCDDTDNTDTETLDEAFEDDDETIKTQNVSKKTKTIESSPSKTSQYEIRNSKSACENKLNNSESLSEKLISSPNVEQQPHKRNSNLSSVNENNSDNINRSSARVGSSQPSVSTTKNTSDTDSYGNLKKQNTTKSNNRKNKNDEQIEKIENLSELAECDRDNFIKTQTTSMGQTQTKASTSTVAPESPRLGRSRSSSPPNRTSNKPLQLNSSDYAEIYKCSSQREREPVIEEPLSPTTPLSPTESCDQFYDLTNDISNNPTIPLPKVTVADYSEDSHNSNIEPDVFYDFETVNTNYNGDKNLSKSPPKYPPPPLSPSAQFKSRSTSPIDIVTLEDIEEEEDEDDWHFVSDNKNDESNNENTSSTDKSLDSKQQQQQQQQQPNCNSPKPQSYLSSPTFGRKMDTLTISGGQQKPPSPTLSRKSPLRQRSPFDYDDHADGLNTPDSGIGGATTPISATINSSSITVSSSTNSSNKVLVINSCDLVNDTDDIELLQSHQKQSTTSSYFNIQSDNTNNIIHNNGNIVNFCESNNNYIEHNSTSIVIDSISLPDVVIESKPKEPESQNQLTVNNNQNGDYILNVSKSKSEGNVHFIPIHVEGREKPKIEIVEETTEFSSSIDNNNNNNNNINNNNNNSDSIINNGFIEDISNQNNSINDSDNINNSNIDIISNITVIKADETVTEIEDQINESFNTIGNSYHSKDNEDYMKLEKDLQQQLKKANEEKQKKEEELKRELVSQEARFNAQLQEAQKNASSAQERAHELQMKIDQLEQDISLKSWHIERLNGEIQAIQQEHTSVRKRLQTIEDEKERIRQKHLDEEDEFNNKYENLEDKYKELEEKYNKLRQLASTLQTQLAIAKSEIDDLQIKKDQLCEEKDAELKNLQELLDKAIEERKELEIKWQKEFELLRNHNQEHEEQLLTDCEYQLRSMQKKCKEKIETAEKAKQEVLERNAELEEKVAEGEGYSERLKNLQAEVRQLRGLTNEQRESITFMHTQIEELKNDLEAANIDLESKIEEVRKIKLFCDNTLLFKDREMIQKIDEATREVATIWEDKLLTEMTRLTNELEAVHSEERLSDMNKLQAEHIEELKVLTNRYTSNEEELRKQLEEVSEKLQDKTEKYLELRDKTDEEILKTRIHLDRADREYQQAMNRELDKKIELEEKLRKEFEEEKAEMEANFQRRINEAKENFKKEMSNQTQEIAQRHRLQLEQQWDQLAAEKEDALQTLEKRHKIKLEDQENRLRELVDDKRNVETQHRRDLKDLKEAYDLDRSALQNRDIHNSQEIEQLHRKCRCLTNLFEEMRLRYERREPRPEDLREIDELRARCDSQERDLCELTERLREMQMQMEEMQAVNDEQQYRHSGGNRKKPMIRKPPPKQIPISCDVIYEEENEETESLGDETKNGQNNKKLANENDNDENDDDDDDDNNNDEDEEEEN